MRELRLDRVEAFRGMCVRCRGSSSLKMMIAPLRVHMSYMTSCRLQCTQSELCRTTARRVMVDYMMVGYMVDCMVDCVVVGMIFVMVALLVSLLVIQRFVAPLWSLLERHDSASRSQLRISLTVDLPSL